MKEYLDHFIHERNWDKYRTPKNLSMALAVEVSELMEIFQWIDGDESKRITNDPQKKEEIEGELADILSYLVQLAGMLKIDLYEAFWKKTTKNEQKHLIKT